MQTHLPASLLATPEGREADAILRRCVHCGFCTATCPTYQLLGDELDGPRGRIYLIKQLLEETHEPEVSGEATRDHLDRCLTCRSCETTCPSGVEYNRLLDIGRERIEATAPRRWPDRLMRWGLRQVVPYPGRFRALLRLVTPLRGVMPRVWREALPPIPKADTPWPATRHARRVILLQGCVQSVAAAEINRAAARVLDSLGISAIRVRDEGCCGALDQHLAAPQAAADAMRANIDAWWPLLQQDGQTDTGAAASEGAEAIVSTASACGLQVKDYGYYLRHDPAYADKARRVSARVKDIAELLAAEPPGTAVKSPQRVAFHAPCTLQHGQHLTGVVEGILQAWGFEALPVTDGHLCCGSAGTYSLTQPGLSRTLRDNKLAALQQAGPEVIASANIGCLLHLRKAAAVPVRHWIELLAEAG